jgi:hypothetical protein
MKVVSRVGLIYRVVAHNVRIASKPFAYEIPELYEFILDSISVVVKRSKGCYRFGCVVIVREILGLALSD